MEQVKAKRQKLLRPHFDEDLWGYVGFGFREFEKLLLGFRVFELF